MKQSASALMETKDPGESIPSGIVNGYDIAPISYRWKIKGKWDEGTSVENFLNSKMSLTKSSKFLFISTLDAQPLIVTVGHSKSLDGNGLPADRGDWEVIDPNKFTKGKDGYSIPISAHDDDRAIAINLEFPLILPKGHSSDDDSNDRVTYLIRVG